MTENIRIHNEFWRWIRVVSTVAAGLSPALGGAAERDGVRLRAEWAGDRRVHEVQIRRKEPGSRLVLLLRDTHGGTDEMRLGLEVRLARGRLVAGHQRHLTGGASRGWSTPLAVRRAPSPAAMSLSRTASGVSWSGPLRGAVARVGAGRDRSGGVIAGAAAAARGVELGIRWDAGRPVGRLAGARRAGALAWRSEIIRVGRDWLVRSGLGGGDAPVGAVGSWRAGENGRAWSLAGGVAARDGAWRGTRAEVRVGRRTEGDASRADSGAAGRVELRIRAWRIASEVRVRRTSAVGSPPRYRFAAESRARGNRVRLSMSAGGATTASVRLDVGPSRSRTGIRVELPAGRGRRGALWLRRVTEVGDFRVEFEWNRSAPASVELEWGWSPRRAGPSGD